jgi:hypothetical protein
VLAAAVLALSFATAIRANAQPVKVIHIFDSEDACDTGGPVEPGTPVFSGILAHGRDGNIYGTVLHSFGFVGTEGAAADGGVTLASDGNLYGTNRGFGMVCTFAQKGAGLPGILLGSLKFVIFSVHTIRRAGWSKI